MYVGTGPMAWRQLRRRWHRTVALLLGVVVASGSFLVLTATAATSRLQVVDTVRSNFRSAYDIVVRPAGSVTPLEARDNLVRGNFASGIFGGIRTDQVAAVRALPGVEVAAPIAVVGVTEQLTKVPVNVQSDLGPADRQVLKVAVTRTSSAAPARPDSPQYLYATSGPASAFPPHTPVVGDQIFGASEVIDGHKTPICPSRGTDADATTPFTDDVRSDVWCWSAVSGPVGSARTLTPLDTPSGVRAQVPVPVPFTFVLVAVDPDAEARLEGLDRTVTDGRYLQPHEGTGAPVGGFASVPVLVADRPFTNESTQVTVQRLGAGGTAIATSGADSREQFGPLAAQPATTLRRQDLDTGAAYRQLVAQLRGTANPFANLLGTYWTGSPVSYTTTGSTSGTPPETWAAPLASSGMTYLPKATDGQAFRTLVPHQGNNFTGTGSTAGAVTVHAVGVFDPTRLAGFSALAYPGLSTYQQPTATAADAPTSTLLDGKPLTPDGYLTQPPSLITTMDALPSLVDPDHCADGNATAPVSVIRVRVADVHGPDALSRERIRRVAEQIHTRTGLDVDITAGSSATAVRVALPADPAAGRPALLLNEAWAKKGTALTVLSQVDRKSLLLFLLVLAVCAMFVANASAAALRSRRAELAVLSCPGWTRRQLIALVLQELLAVGAAAGLFGVALAVPTAALAGVQLHLARGLLVVPAAAALTALAGLPPALSASRVSPLTALRPAVHPPRRARSPQGVGGLAVTGLTNVPGRSLLAAATLGVAVAALTLLLSISVGFRGAVTGSLLGDAVTVQVRGPDYAAALTMVALGVIVITDVLYIGVRERAGEYAVLRASGWDDANTTRLLATEGCLLGAAGATAGALVGLTAGTATAGHLQAPVVAATLLGDS